MARAAELPALMRALVACGWFGITGRIGGQALDTLFKAIIPGWHTCSAARSAGTRNGTALSFLLFGA